MGVVDAPPSEPIAASDGVPKQKRSRKLTASAKRRLEDDDGLALTEEKPLKKKRAAKSTKDAKPIGEDTDEDINELIVRPRKTKKGAPDEEKRLKRFRDRPPQSYKDVEERALTQRMFVIERTRSGTEECPEETIELAGSTGNIYTIQICKVPECNCPHAKKGNQCKHIIYVMVRVLRAPTNLQYQLALLTSELREILANAPPILSPENTSKDGNRKEVTDDCPICCTEFEPDKEEIVWCKAACGNNLHKACFEQWAATKQGAAGGVTCPLCRTPWMGDEDMLKRVAKSGKKNAEGYTNVAAELGISGQRDHSTYHSYWVRRQIRNGVDVGDWVDPDGY